MCTFITCNRITFLYFSVSTVKISFCHDVAQLWKARPCLCSLLSLLAILATLFIIFAVLMFVISIVTTTHMPSNTTITAYQAQSSKVVFQLATFESTDHSSFLLTSDIPPDTTTSATVWITHSIEPTSSMYSGSLTLQYKTFHLYIPCQILISNSPFRLCQVLVLWAKTLLLRSENSLVPNT